MFGKAAVTDEDVDWRNGIVPDLIDMSRQEVVVKTCFAG